METTSGASEEEIAVIIGFALAVAVSESEYAGRKHPQSGHVAGLWRTSLDPGKPHLWSATTGWRNAGKRESHSIRRHW